MASVVFVDSKERGLRLYVEIDSEAFILVDPRAKPSYVRLPYAIWNTFLICILRFLKFTEKCTEEEWEDVEPYSERDLDKTHMLTNNVSITLMKHGEIHDGVQYYCVEVRRMVAGGQFSTARFPSQDYMRLNASAAKALWDNRFRIRKHAIQDGDIAAIASMLEPLDHKKYVQALTLWAMELHDKKVQQSCEACISGNGDPGEHECTALGWTWEAYSDTFEKIQGTQTLPELKKAYEAREADKFTMTMDQFLKIDEEALNIYNQLALRSLKHYGDLKEDVTQNKKSKIGDYGWKYEEDMPMAMQRKQFGNMNIVTFSPKIRALAYKNIYNELS